MSHSFLVHALETLEKEHEYLQGHVARADDALRLIEAVEKINTMIMRGQRGATFMQGLYEVSRQFIQYRDRHMQKDVKP
jgi:citrate synthase